MLAAFSRLSDQIQITALAPTQGPLQQALQGLNVNHVPFALRDQQGVKRTSESLLREWNRTANDYSIDLLHANSLSMCRHLGRTASLLKIPATGHIRDIMKLKPKAIRDLNSLAAVVAVSEATRDFHVDQGLSDEACEVIYNGVDTDRFAPRQRTGYLHKELGLPRHISLAATIGQICLRKGQVDLAHAAAHIKVKFPDLHFLLIGQRHSAKAESIAYDEKIDAIFASAGISHRLHRLGYRDDISQLLNEVDLLIHPARQEPLGRVLLEAAASALPIVTTAVGGTSEILCDLDCEHLITPGEPSQLATAIQRTLENVPESRRMAERMHNFVTQRFNIDNQSTALLRFWESKANS